MTGSEWSVLGGVFPWLEAIVVIPVGVLAGLPPVLVVLVAVTGNLLTVGLAAVFGQRLRIRWTARRRARGETAAKSEDPAKLERRNRRRAREAIAWVGAGTVAWSVVAAVLTVSGVSIAGIGT